MDPLTSQILDAFKSFFIIPNIPATSALIAVAIAILFGAIWIAAFYPPLFRQPWLWVILVASFFATAILTAFIQLPFQYAVTKIFDTFLSRQDMLVYFLIVGIPVAIIAAIVQVGAKLLPVIIYWIAGKRTLEPKTALFFGLFAGAGVGVIEAFQFNSQLFAFGWDISLIKINGLVAILPFIERFFIIGFHASAIAIAAYGLAKGKWWQFSLVVVVLYFIHNYSSVLLGLRVINAGYIEIIILIVAILTAAGALWLRWLKNGNPKLENKTTK